MKCTHCNKDFEPRVKYCSAKCRVYASRGVRRLPKTDVRPKELDSSVQSELSRRMSGYLK